MFKLFIYNVTKFNQFILKYVDKNFMNLMVELYKNSRGLL